MRRVLSGLVGSALISASAGAVPAPVAKEAYFGVVGQKCPVPDLRPDAGIQHAVQASSAPPDHDSAIVKALLSSISSEDHSGLTRIVSREWLSSEVSESCLSSIKSLQSECQLDPLYLLGDLEIRLSWRCGSKIAYYHYITIADGVVTNIWAKDGMKPPIVIACPDPARATKQAVWNGTTYIEKCKE